MIKPLILTGMMGSGKSTLGKALAQKHALPFVDTDERIEARAGRTIEEIFREEPGGPGVFRALEAEIVREVLTTSAGRSVIALGGGALLDDGIRRMVLERGMLVWLKARPEGLAQRLAGQVFHRPLLKGAASEHELLKLLSEIEAARHQVYSQAHLAICTDDRTPDELCDTLSALYFHSNVRRIDLGPHSHSLWITHEPASVLSEQLRLLSPSSVYMLSDTQVHSLWGQSLQQELERRGHRIQTLRMAQGEAAKTWEQAGHLLSSLIEAGADRGSLLLALGGGAVNDVTGFVASVLFRGIAWISIPSTLLAMIDASVGGKTGVDLGSAKNSVGRIHQPKAVIIDPRMLRTEGERSFRSGLAEMVKAGLMLDAELFCTLEMESAHLLARREDVLQTVITRAIHAKAGVVERDEQEQGERVVLNFGHTVGHALEALGRFERFTHGEAVALGMVVEARIGETLGFTPAPVVSRLIDVLESLGLEPTIERTDMEQGLSFIQYDKKRRGPRLRTAFPSELGRSHLTEINLSDFCAEALKNTGKTTK